MGLQKIQIDENDDGSTADEIINHLKDFNVSNIGPSNRLGLTLSLKDSNETLVAGLIGYTHWDWLFISILWVKDNYRGQGLGTNIVKRAEEIARKRGCRGVHLDTFDFQAPIFYQKLSYEFFGEIPNCPINGKRRIFLKKIFQV